MKFVKSIISNLYSSSLLFLLLYAGGLSKYHKKYDYGIFIDKKYETGNISLRSFIFHFSFVYYEKAKKEYFLENSNDTL